VGIVAVFARCLEQPRVAVCGLLAWFVALSLVAVEARGAAQETLATRLRKALAADARVLERAGVRIVTLPEGEVVYSSPRADELFIPASNQKVLVSAAALDLLGPGFRFSTQLAQRGDDLVVFGDGDPSTGDPVLADAAGKPITALFHDWAEALRKAGVTDVAGDLIVDDFAFDAQRLHPSWSKGDLLKWYAAPVGGLNLNDNCVDLTVVPGKKPGGATSVRVVPGNTLVKVVNRSKTGGKGTPVVTRKGMSHEYIITGRCSKTAPLQSVPVVDPGLFFGSACRTALAAKGIRINGETRRERLREQNGSVPEACRVIATRETRLDEILGRMNKRSQNLFAEALLKALGRQDATPTAGTWVRGGAVVGRFLSKLNADVPGCVVDDGSGLSRKNRVSPRQITDVLAYVFRSPHREIYVDSLAVAGVDGTLRKRMKDIKGRVHAKTGYISGVRTLSGYVQGKSGRWFAFSFLFNDKKPRIGTRPATQMQDRICRILAGE